MKMRHGPLYQLNTRVFLREQSQGLGRQASFDDVPERLLSELASEGFEWLYLLGVWQTGPAALGVSRASPVVRGEGKAALADFGEDDIIGSPFAIQRYEPHAQFGGAAALRRLRQRTSRHGLRLMLDFVPNHIAPDHEWVSVHPEYLILGNKDDIMREPQNWGRFHTASGPRIFAFGRDPFFPGWTDTVQLNYRHQELRRAMMNQLARVAEYCDGLRCDMAMLLEPDVFANTWGDRARPRDGFPPVDVPFWPEAIAGVRSRNPDFIFMAEVYWDLEWRLQQHGFDFTYDKRLYDRLHAASARPVREHLQADMTFQDHSARFLENHDEPRAAQMFPMEMHRAAALITFLVPGLRFFHEGQREGCKVHTSMHLGRRPQENTDQQIRALYDRLIRCLQRREVQSGHFDLWQPRPAWEGNPTWDNFVCFSWRQERRALLAVANYAATRGQCYVTLGLDSLGNGNIRLSDLLGSAQYDRHSEDLRTRGLYLDMPAWGCHLFEVFGVS